MSEQPERYEVALRADGWHVVSTDGARNLGGPYPSRGDARARLRFVAADPAYDRVVAVRPFFGLSIAIENPAGSTRRWFDAAGQESGSTIVCFPYGFIEGALGSDGDYLDCYIGPDENAPFVFVVHQLGPDGRADEDKVFLCFADEAAAKATFLAHRDDGDRAFGGMNSIPRETFLAKLARRTGSGPIRHATTPSRIDEPLGALALDPTAPPAARRRKDDSMVASPVLLKAIRGHLQLFDASPGPDGRVRIGVWDRFCTMGQKVKEGEESVFSTETLGQMMENWYARGGRLAMCQDHKSSATPYVAAPALAFYDAMAIVEGGKIVRFRKLAQSAAVQPSVAALRDTVQRFATTEDPSPTPDGLWGFRCEVTPLGEDPREGLRNYRGISPMFVTDGKDEQDRPIGYVLFDVAATNTAFQAGCEITFSVAPRATMARPGDLVACPACGREVAVKRAALATAPTIEGHRDPRTNQPCAGAGQDAKALTATRRFDAAGAAQTMSSVTVYGGGRVMVEVNTRSASVDSVIGVLDGVYQTSPPRSGGDFVQRFYVDGPGATASNVVRELRNYGIDAAEGRGGDVPLRVSFTASGSELRPGDTVVTNGFVGGKWSGTVASVLGVEPDGTVLITKPGWGTKAVAGSNLTKITPLELSTPEPAPATTLAAGDWYGRIKQNVDDFYAGRIDYAEFTQRNRVLWDSIPTGERGAVADQIRRDLPTAQVHTALLGHTPPQTMNRRATTMAKAVPFPRPLTTDQEIFDVLAALRAAGIHATSSAEATRAVVVPDADEARAREIVAQHFGAAPTTMAGDGSGGTVHAPKYKVGDQVWASGEDNPLTVLEVIAEGDTGSMKSGQWVKDWLYRVRSAKGHEFRVWLSRGGGGTQTMSAIDWSRVRGSRRNTDGSILRDPSGETWITEVVNGDLVTLWDGRSQRKRLRKSEIDAGGFTVATYARGGGRQTMARDIRGTPVGQGDKIRVVRSDNPKLVGLEGTVTFEDGGYLTVATTRNGLMAAFDVAAGNVEKVGGGPTIHSAQTMGLVDVRTLPAGRRIRIPQFGSDKVYVTRGNGWYGGEGGYDGGPWHASYDQPPVMVEDLGPAAPGTFGRRRATTMATPGEDYAKFRDICRRHNATDMNQVLVRGFWARFGSVADATAAASEVRAAGMPVFFNPSKPEIATNSSIGGCNSTSPPTLHAQATSGVVVHAATGVSGQVLRRYAVGPAPWLLVRTPHGVVSWPADEARAAA